MYLFIYLIIGIYVYFQVEVPEFPADEIYPPPKQNSLKKNDIYEHSKYKDVHKHVKKVLPCVCVCGFFYLVNGYQLFSNAFY